MNANEVTNNISIVGLDLAKNTFQIHAVDQAGKAVLKKKLIRRSMEKFFTQLAPCTVAMEGCSSAHYWGRKLQRLGHEIHIIPAQ